MCEVEGNKLLSGSGDKSVKFWDLKNFKCLGTFVNHTNYVFSILNLGNKIFCSGDYDGKVNIWKLN